MDLNMSIGYVDSRYPNEVPGFTFYVNAMLDRLTPLVSPMKNVGQVLGNPDEVKRRFRIHRTLPWR
jgi:hypothetical protein